MPRAEDETADLQISTLIAFVDALRGGEVALRLKLEAAD